MIKKCPLCGSKVVSHSWADASTDRSGLPVTLSFTNSEGFKCDNCHMVRSLGQEGHCFVIFENKQLWRYNGSLWLFVKSLIPIDPNDPPIGGVWSH